MIKNLLQVNNKLSIILMIKIINMIYYLYNQFLKKYNNFFFIISIKDI